MDDEEGDDDEDDDEDNDDKDEDAVVDEGKDKDAMLEFTAVTISFFHGSTTCPSLDKKKNTSANSAQPCTFQSPAQCAPLIFCSLVLPSPVIRHCERKESLGSEGTQLLVVPTPTNVARR